MLLLFWSSPNAFLGGTYFPLGQVGGGAVHCWLYYLVFHVLQAERKTGV